MSDALKVRRLQKLLGNTNAQAGPSKRKHNDWNMLRHSSTVASRDLDRFDLYDNANASIPHFLLYPQTSDENTPPAKECIICRESDVEFSPAPPTDQCLHQPQACTSCISQIIKVAVVSGGNTSSIRCPTTTCGEPLAYDDVQHAVGSDYQTFDRYNELLLQKVLQQDEGYITCLDPACGAGQVHGGQNIFPIVECYRCGAKTCYQHRVEWHEGYSCKEWDKREERWTREEILSREWIDDQTKRCPGRGCNRPIRRDSGCDHMTCKPPGGCGHEFCWVCFAPYGPIRSEGCEKHNHWCKYYTGTAPPQPPSLPVEPSAPTSSRTRWQFWRRDNDIPVATLL